MMVIKDVLVLVEHSAASRQRMEYALAIAERFSARITVMALVPHPYVPALVGVHIPAELMQAQIREGERSAELALQAAADLARARGTAIVQVTESGPLEALEFAFARAARLADLSVVGQPDEDSITLVAEAAFLRTGRPAIVVPFIGAQPGPVRRALIAWNGSRESARAVHDALPFLLEAEHTTVLVIGQQAEDGAAPGSSLAAHLARHGVRTEVTALPSGGLAVGDAILAQAAAESADLLVMGGYGHSRMRELVLGGATRQVLAQMPLPVLMSH